MNLLDQSIGHLTFIDEYEYYFDNGSIYKAATSNVIDLMTRARCGRFFCDLNHVERFKKGCDLYHTLALKLESIDVSISRKDQDFTINEVIDYYWSQREIGDQHPSVSVYEKYDLKDGLFRLVRDKIKRIESGLDNPAIDEKYFYEYFV